MLFQAECSMKTKHKSNQISALVYPILLKNTIEFVSEIILFPMEGRFAASLARLPPLVWGGSGSPARRHRRDGKN